MAQDIDASSEPRVVVGMLEQAKVQGEAEEAYIYGYPLISMEMPRRVMTNFRELEGTRAPMGHLIRVREYPTAAFRDVTAPNADTLYLPLHGSTYARSPGS